MKKLLISLALVCGVGLLLAACAADQTPGQQPNAEPLSGEPADILSALIDACEVEMVNTLDVELTADNAQYYLGLSSDQFTNYVKSVAVKEAAINAQAHLVAVIECADADAASEVKTLIAENFDPQRWVCVSPEQCFVVDSGNYLLLAATYDDVAEALKTAFATAAGSSMGTVDVFYPN